MTRLVLPNLSYPDGVFIPGVPGDDVAQATRHISRSLQQQPEQRVALPGLAGHLADQAVHIERDGADATVRPLLVADLRDAEHEHPTSDVVEHGVRVLQDVLQVVGVLGRDRQDLFPSALIKHQLKCPHP
jgi:hypothetical protein